MTNNERQGETLGCAVQRSKCHTNLQTSQHVHCIQNTFFGLLQTLLAYVREEWETNYSHMHENNASKNVFISFVKMINHELIVFTLFLVGKTVCTLLREHYPKGCDSMYAKRCTKSRTEEAQSALLISSKQWFNNVHSEKGITREKLFK